MNDMPNKEEIVDFFKSLQDEICQALEKTDGKSKFQEDKGNIKLAVVVELG